MAGSSPPRPEQPAIQLVGGAVHIHLACSACSQQSWDHQQIAWLAERIALEVAKAGIAVQPPVQLATPSVVPHTLVTSPVAINSAVSSWISPSQNAVATTSSLGSSERHSRAVQPALPAGAPPQPTPPPTKPQALGKKGPRARTGCFTCRMKRVKCDETKPACLRCTRNPERQCVYPRTFMDAQLKPPRPKGPASGSSTPALAPAASSLTIAPTWRQSHVARARPNGTMTLHPSSSLLNTAPPHSVINAQPQPPGYSDQFDLFLDGINFISAPALLNAQPTKREARARCDRVLAKLWEAQMIVSVSGVESVGQGKVLPVVMSQQVATASALVAVARSFGAVRRAYVGMNPTPEHDQMMARSRVFAQAAAAPIQAFARGEGYNDPETFLILLGLFLLRDCAIADPQWGNTRELLVAYVQRMGGPKKMLDEERVSTSGNSLLEQHLVYLALYDTFAALSLDTSPYLLSHSNRPWIEHVTCAQQVIQSDFGFSLRTLLSVTDLATLLAKRPNRNDITSPQATQYAQECHAMYEQLETVNLATIYATPAPARVQFGDFLIRHALICHLQRVAFERPADDPVVQRSAAAVMELLAEVAVHTGSMINLIYPMLVVAGLLDKEDQDRLQTIIDFVKVSSGLLEIECVQSIAHEAWRRADAGEDELKMTDIWNKNAPILIL